MKKLYVSLFSVAVAFGVNAQNAPLAARKMRADVQPSGLIQPVVNPSSAGGVSPIWSNDFSNAADWTIANTAGNNSNWVIGTAAPNGDFPIAAILSTSAANGFALFDSDAFCTAGDDATVSLANPIDLSGYNAVVVTFEQFYRAFQGTTYLEVSTNGTDWTSYEVNASVAVNASTANPDVAQVNVSGVAGGQSQVWIRFRYVGACDYAWMVDDVAIIQGADNDMELVDVWHGDIINAFEYTSIPVSQAQEVVIGAASVNQGGASQTVVTYTYDIALEGTSVSSGTFTATNSTLASAAGDTTWYATGFTPTSQGNYTVTISVGSAEGDDNATNNEGSSAFNVTEFIYGHDDIDNIEFQIYGGVDDNDSPNEFKTALFYEVLEDVTLYGVQVAFGANTTTTSAYVEVFDAADLTTALVTEVYDLQPGDVSSGANINLVNIPIDGGAGLQLTAGVTYVISIGNTGPGENLWILASDGDDDRAVLQYGPFGAGGAIDWYTGYTYSSILRANFNPAVGISENEDLTGIQMFPNPANDVLTVKFNANESNDIRINIVSMDGKVVYSQNAEAFAGQFTSRIGLNGLSTGIYSVQVMSNNATFTQKVAVVK
jgi:hypothetical protein